MLLITFFFSFFAQNQPIITADSMVVIQQINIVGNQKTKVNIIERELDFVLGDSIKKEDCIGYNDGSITLTVSGGTRPYKFLWDNGATSASISGLAAQKYNVTISDSNSCKIDTALTVTLRCDFRDSTKRTGFVYDVITPNGDGKNDKWIVTNIDNYPNNELIIYNRWGQPVYAVKPYRNTWEGTTDDGKDLPSAAYYYLIKLNDDKQQIWAGSITVIR